MRKKNLSKRPESIINVFEAIKRARIRRGFFPDKLSASDKNGSGAKKPSGASPSQSSSHTSSQTSSKSSDAKSTEDREKTKKLSDVAANSHEVLFKATTVFPFTLFPDTVTLDREKLSFASRTFFRVAKVTSIPVRDILSAEAHLGPFLGSVHTSSRYFVTNPYSINFMWRQEAIRLHRLLQGYIIAHEQDIDCSKIPKEKLLSLLNDLGKGDTS